MSTFTNQIKTILKLDDKEWKKALKSIGEAEKQYYKESSKNTDELITAKDKLAKLEKNKADELKKINQDIAKSESNKTKAIELGNKQLEKSFNRRLKLYKQQRRDLESNSKIELDEAKQSVSLVEKKVSAQIKYNQILKNAKQHHSEYGAVVKKSNEDIRQAISMTNKKLDEKLRLDSENRKNAIKTAVAEVDARHDVVNSLKKQKTEALKTAMAEIDAKHQVLAALKKQKIAEVKHRSDVIYSLKSQKREQEELNQSLREEFNNTYKNTKQQNQYNEAKKKLDKLQSQGIITKDQYNQALDIEQKNLKKADKATKSSTNSLVRHLRQIETLVVAYYTLSRGFQFTIGKGIQVNKMVEDNTNGIAALLSANTQMVLSNGQVVNSYEKFKIGQTVAKKTMEDIRKASVETYATFPQLTEIYQQAIGQTLSMGDAFGTTIDEISANTTKLSQRMSNIAGAIGMPMDRVREEIRSLLSGNASTDSLISTMIFGSPGEANEAIRMAKQRGTNGLKDMLDSYLASFDVLGGIDTYSRALLRLQDSWDYAMKKIVKDSGAFEDIKNMFNDMAVSISQNTNELVEDFDSIYKGLKTIISLMDELAVAGLMFYGAKGLIAGMTSYNAITRKTSVGLSGLVANSKKFIALNAPLIAATVAITAAQTSLYNKEEKANKELKERLKTTKTLVELSKTQAEDKALLESLELQADYIAKRAKTEKFASEDQIANMKKEYDLLHSQIDILEKRKNLTDEQRKSFEKTKEIADEIGKLQTKIPINKKDLEGVVKFLESSKDPIVKMKEEIEKALKLQEQLGKRYANASTSQARKKVEEDILKTKDFILKKEEDISKEEEDRADEKQKINKKTRDDAEKLLSLQAESLNLSKLLNNEEILRSEKLLAQIETVNDKINIAKDEDKKLELVNNLLKKQIEYQSALKKEEEDRVKANEKNIQSIVDEYEEWYKAEEKISKELEKIADNKDFEIKLDFNIDSDLENIIDNVDGIVKSQSKLNDYLTAYNKLTIKTDKDKEKLNKAEDKHQENMIAGYSNMAGSMSDMLKEGSDGANALMVIQSSLAMVNAVNGVLSAMGGDPYTMIARVAKATFVANALLSNIGKTLSSTKTSVSQDELSSIKANEGKGTVLGDATAQSESVANALSVLEDFAKPEFELISQMNRSLISIDQKMGGVANLLVRQGGFAFGQDYKGSFDTGFKNNIALEATLNPINSLISQIPVIGQINGLFGNVVSGALGGLFGKTSSSRELSDAGLIFGQQLLSQALEDFEGSAFQTIKTTTTKKSWFKKSTSTSYSTSLQDLNDETERQFELLLNNMYDTVVGAGGILGITEQKIESDLSDFYVNLGKISLKGKSGSQIQELLNNIFGKFGDELTAESIPGIENFQQVGEGLFETLSRLAVGIQEADYYAGKLGTTYNTIDYQAIENKQGEIGFESLRQSILESDKVFYGFNNNISKIIETMSGSASDLYNTYKSLQDVRVQFGFLNKDLEGITSKLLLGADGADSLKESLDSYIENYYTESEKLVFETQKIAAEFARLNLDVPKSKEEFKKLAESLDTSTEEGQKLYGQLISLNDEFSDFVKIQDSLVENQSNLNGLFNTYLKTVEDMNSIFVSLEEKTRTTILSIKSESESTFDQLVSYNKLQQEFAEISKTGDNEAIQKTYDELLNVSKALSSKGYDKSILGYLESNIPEFEKEQEILRVNIVEGLGELLQLNASQKESLQTVALDGKITNDELSGIAGISEDQKQGIRDVADRTNLLSTEKNQEDANDLMKLQLQTLRAQVEEETEKLSSKSFQYGDIIGSQEQKDIASLLGTSYPNVKDFISRVQELDISQDKTGDLKKLLGFTSTSIDENAYEMIEKLSPYIGKIGSEAENIKNEAEQNKFQQDKINFNKTLANALNYFYAEKSQADSVRNLLGSDQGIVSYENYSSGARARFGGGERDYSNTDTKRFNKYKTEFSQALKAYNDYQNLLKIKAQKGYYHGGFTGKGNPTEISGFTHYNEEVINARDLQRVGGSAEVNKFIANGGNTDNTKEINTANRILDKISSTMVKLSENIEDSKGLLGSINSLQNQTLEAVSI